MTVLHRIDLISTGRGDRAIMHYRGSRIGVSEAPLLWAARWLLTHGRAAQGDLIETYREGMPCAKAKVGIAAGLTMKEGKSGGITFQKWRPPETRYKTQGNKNA